METVLVVLLNFPLDFLMSSFQMAPENRASLALNSAKSKARYLALSHCWAETTKESLWTLAMESIASLELELSQVFYLKLSITLLKS
jgi:hypothetical protein